MNKYISIIFDRNKIPFGETIVLFIKENLLHGKESII